MRAIIVCLGDARGGRAIAGQYLRRYDPDGCGGAGLIEWTPDRALALVFPTKIDAFNAWRAVSATHPVRLDGLPNRPLTAFTIEIIPAG